MKKLWIAFAIAMAALMVIASPVFASGGNADADVDCSDIDVTDDSPTVGTTITFSGNVTINCSANYSQSYWSGGYPHDALAVSQVWYRVYNPDGVLIVDYTFPAVWDYDSGSVSDYPEWLFEASADASQSVDWSVDVYIDMIGDYIAAHGGQAYAYYGHWVWVGGRNGYWQHVYDDTDYDCCSANRTVTSHAGAGLGMIARSPRLTIQLPAELAVEKPLHAEHFFPSDGWGDPTTEYIVYSDGIWQVEIADGTIIQLDGEWHKYTWIEVDDQGNVIGRYGSDGHIIAEEIGLSQPITITKVG